MSDKQLEKTQSMIFYKGISLDACKSDLNCFWDHHPFEGYPWFCPISYLEDKKSYEVDGVFCSFDCANAYIYENNNNILYKDSQQLLALMHYQRYNKYPEDVQQKAPSWRLIDCYGGDRTISEFRSCQNNCKIIQTDIIERPFYCFPIFHNFTVQQKWGLT